MKFFKSVLPVICTLWLLSPKLHAQIYDFDSLMQHDEAFKKIATAVADTMDLFNDHSLLEVTLETDFKNLLKKKSDPEYQSGVFRMMFNDTVMINSNIKIKPRGNMRRKTCYIPPLKLNFPKKKTALRQLQHFDKIKMVVTCKSSNLYEQYLLQEYYAYRIYNILSDYSLRVRLLKVRYIDTSHKLKPFTKFSFIIEDIDLLAARHNCIRIESKIIGPATDLPVLADVYLFQYMIGNTDWSIPGLHNIYMIKPKDPMKPKPIVVPYDFDYAGIVNATYAVPDPQLGIETVRERIYRGRCIDEKFIYAAAKKFRERKQQVLGLYEKDQYLSKGSKNSTIGYLENFYKQIKDDKTTERNIVDECRQ